MPEPKCADCRFFHKLKHNFEVGKGFKESHCCTIMLEHDFEPSVKDITWVQEVEENSRCEMFTEKGSEMPCVSVQEMQKCKDIVKKYTPKQKTGHWIWNVEKGLWYWKRSKDAGK